MRIYYDSHGYMMLHKPMNEHANSRGMVFYHRYKYSALKGISLDRN